MTARIYHADLYGLREEKYAVLRETDVSSTEWTEVQPGAPYYLFVPVDERAREEYEEGPSIAEAFCFQSIGLNSHRDAFAVSFQRGEAAQRLHLLGDPTVEAETLRARFGLVDTSDFSLAEARRAVLTGDLAARSIEPCLYRPFDFRYLLYHGAVLDRPRQALNDSFVGGGNLGLVTTRQTREPFGALAVTRICGQHKITARYDGSYIFPLRIAPTAASPSSLFEPEAADAAARRPNLAPSFIDAFSHRLGMRFTPDGRGDRMETFGPEDVFSYIYALFYSPTYRARYAEFLKIDFPRVPLTRSPALLRSLCALGDELVGLHLMERMGPSIARYPVAGTDEVERVRYSEPGQGADEGRVWINSTQCFVGVPPEVWEFQIGGYQVCEKWLKDRKGRVLSFEDQTHYKNIVSALSETIRLMEDIDTEIEEEGGWPIG